MIHRLVLRLEDGKELTLHIGDDEKAAAETLLQVIAERFPHIAIGKETICTDHTGDGKAVPSFLSAIS